MNTCNKAIGSLLNEPLQEVKWREKNQFNNQTKNVRKFLIFGAGSLGIKCSQSLKKHGYKVLGFIDNNTELQKSYIGELKVYSPKKAWLTYGDSAGILIAIYSGQVTDTMKERVGRLKKLGFSKIAHFGHFAWKNPEGMIPHYSIDLPSKIILQKNKIKAALKLFTEKKSMKLFLNHIAWRLSLDFNLLPKPVNETIYFNKELFRPNKNEFLIDGGAFDGDTIRSFVKTFGKIGFFKALCFEPDPKNFAILKKNICEDGQKKGMIKIFQSALGKSNGVIKIECSGTFASRAGYGCHKVTVKKIDNLSTKYKRPTFVKLDIEGSELAALLGAKKTIRQSLPILAISAYHKQNDLWELPLMLNKMQPAYDFRLRNHVADGWDLVLYAAPKHKYIKTKN